MKQSILALALLAAEVTAQAQSCLPTIDNATHYAYALTTGASKNGAWAQWLCQNKTTQMWELNSYVGTVPELSKVGARLQTIIKSTNPLKSLQTAGARFTILPLSDPSLALVVADMKAQK